MCCCFNKVDLPLYTWIGHIHYFHRDLKSTITVSPFNTPVFCSLLMQVTEIYFSREPIMSWSASPLVTPDTHADSLSSMSAFASVQVRRDKKKEKNNNNGDDQTDQLAISCV